MVPLSNVQQSTRVFTSQHSTKGKSIEMLLLPSKDWPCTIKIDLAARSQRSSAVRRPRFVQPFAALTVAALSSSAERDLGPRGRGGGRFEVF